MTLNKSGLRVAAVVVAVGLAAAACGSSSGTGTSPKGSTGPSASAGKKGGELDLLMVGDFEHLDPQRNYVSSALDFGRLLYRQLTTYASGEGEAGTKLLPDLATDLGTPSNNAKTWTFHLKDGIKFQDGSTITSQDIKYGVERSFSDLIPDGPQYAKQFLVGGAAYKGPFSGQDLPSIETPDAKTIVFQLSAPHGDFGYTVSLPTFAPVPKALDTKQNYDNVVQSSGPYMIKAYARQKSLELVRNPNWDQSTDPVRTALPDTIKCTFGLDPAAIDSRLITSSGADANAIALDSSLQASDVSKVLPVPAVKARSLSGTTGFLRYLALNTTKGATKDLKVRQAINYAINKIEQQTARGGPVAAGDPATTILAPTVGGHKDFNAYPSDGNKGDIAKAKALLGGQTYTVTLASNDTAKAVAQAEFVQADLKQIGITVKINQIKSDVYYSTIGDISKEPEMVFAAWGPDWPSAGTVIPPLFEGNQIVPQGNQNFAQLKEADVDSTIMSIQGNTDPEAANAAYGDLDEKIMTEYAPIVPLLNDKAIFVNGTNVSGSILHGFYGEPDLAVIGLKS